MSTSSHSYLFSFSKQCRVCLLFRKKCCSLMVLLSCPLFVDFIFELAAWIDMLMFTYIMEANGSRNTS